MTAFIMVEPDGQNRIIVAPGALEHVTASDAMRFAPENASADVCLVSLQIAVDAAVATIQIAYGAGTKTIPNPAPAVLLPQSIWSAVDYLTPNETEAAAITSLPSEASAPELLDGLRKPTRAVIVLTLGEQGAYLDEGDSRRLYPAPHVELVVDTTGAGDAFLAAFATAIAEGQDPADAVVFHTPCDATAMRLTKATVGGNASACSCHSSVCRQKSRDAPMHPGLSRRGKLNYW
jgi:ribokinase